MSQEGTKDTAISALELCGAVGDMHMLSSSQRQDLSERTDLDQGMIDDLLAEFSGLCRIMRGLPREEAMELANERPETLLQAVRIAGEMWQEDLLTPGQLRQLSHRDDWASEVLSRSSEAWDEILEHGQCKADWLENLQKLRSREGTSGGEA